MFQDGLAAGKFDNSIWPRLEYTKCVNGLAVAIKGDASHTFRCKNVRVYINHL